MDPRIKVLGWKNDGAVYEIEFYHTGWANRRNRWVTDRVGDARGGNIKRPAHDFVYEGRDFDMAVFNIGYEYEIEVSIDAMMNDGKDRDTEIIFVDSREQYAILKLAHGIDIVAIRTGTGEDTREIYNAARDEEQTLGGLEGELPELLPDPDSDDDSADDPALD